MPGLRTARPATASSLRSAALDGSTVSYTNATDGVITLVSGATTATYNFTGIDPIDMTGSTLTDLVFNLPGNTDTQLEDNGIPADGNSQLRDADGAGFRYDDLRTSGFIAHHPWHSRGQRDGEPGGVARRADLTIGSVTDAAVRPDSISVDNVVTSGTVNLAATGSIGSRHRPRSPTLWRTPSPCWQAAISRASIFRFPPWRLPTPGRVSSKSSTPAIS